ncbi:MAG: hypothetical protein JSR21_13985, partial [Proteobacteria bacterium]|nr:hypothetical protein [Pseudomonadota bacterium]
HAVKRVPILRGMKVVGIVSRSDLVAALARSPDGFGQGPLERKETQ